MNCRSERIVWVDVETSGRIPEHDKILEVGAFVTDLQGVRIGSAFEALFTVDELPSVISSADELVRRMHDKSGLWFDLWNAETSTVEQVERDMLDWLSPLATGANLYLGGNSITLDRNFIAANLPRVNEMISFRSIDVTTLSLSLQSNLHIPRFEKANAHRALPDARDSLAEFLHYMGHMRSRCHI